MAKQNLIISLFQTILLAIANFLFVALVGLVFSMFDTPAIYSIGLGAVALLLIKIKSEA
jgi:hypothetical protein